MRDRLSAIAAARDGMPAVERSPLGRIAQKPDLKRAIGTLFEREPLAGGEAEVGATVVQAGGRRPLPPRESGDHQKVLRRYDREGLRLYPN